MEIKWVRGTLSFSHHLLLPLIVFIVAIVSGATAGVVGFGIGSLLTPLLTARMSADTAIAAVTLPHACATAWRCWRLRSHIDWSVLKRFGTVSAVGALAGAAAYSVLGPTGLARVLGVLLILTAVAQLTGWTSRWTPRGWLVALFGLLSGFFGGIAGNQGGLRSAAMTTFGLSPRTFVATASATGLMVDLVRTPVYLLSSDDPSALPWRIIGIAILGVLIGTALGERLLMGMSPRRFAQVVGAAVGVLGVWMLAP